MATSQLLSSEYLLTVESIVVLLISVHILHVVYRLTNCNKTDRDGQTVTLPSKLQQRDNLNFNFSLFIKQSSNAC